MKIICKRLFKNPSWDSIMVKLSIHLSICLSVCQLILYAMTQKILFRIIPSLDTGYIWTYFQNCWKLVSQLFKYVHNDIVFVILEIKVALIGYNLSKAASKAAKNNCWSIDKPPLTGGSGLFSIIVITMMLHEHHRFTNHKQFGCLLSRLFRLLTHWDQVTHTCVIGLGNHWFR